MDLCHERIQINDTTLLLVAQQPASTTVHLFSTKLYSTYQDMVCGRMILFWNLPTKTLENHDTNFIL